MQTRKKSFIQIVTLGFLNALTPFSIDLYLPSFPGIARDLSSVVPRVSLSVSSYFVGFALGQIFYGPLLDRFGRKKPLYFGLLIYVLASIGCMTARSVEALIVWRFISALGGSAASVGSMTMVRDLFPPKDSAKVFSMLMLVLSVSPLLAPSIGSMVILFWGWRYLFGILTGIAVIDALLVALVLPEPYVPDTTVSMSLVPILKNFGKTLKVRKFWVYTVAGSLSFAGLFVYVAGSPAIFMDYYGVSPKIFGAIFALLATGMIGGGQLNNLLIRNHGTAGVFKTALVAQVVIGAFFFGGAILHLLGLGSTLSFLFAILVCAGITYPNGAALALEPFTKNIGSASALLGFIQLGVGALAAALVGLFDARGIGPTATVMFVLPAIGLTVLSCLYPRPRRGAPAKA